MITINLRPGLKRKRPGPSFAAVGERLSAISARVRDPLLLVAAASWIGMAAWVGWTFLGQARELAALEPRLEQTRSEHRRFKGFIAQKRKQELIRDSLFSQIGVIRAVDGDRYVWPHVLDEIAKALPAYTWLTEVAVQAAAAPPAPTPGSAPAAGAAAAKADTLPPPPPPPLQFQVTGRTVDLQAYTKFLRQLEASPWLANVSPISAQTVVENERPVTAFVVVAMYQPADSAYIRTVPLNQSVR